MESIQPVQACAHRRRDVFMFAYRAQSAINKVTWTLNVIQSELQIQTPSEQKTSCDTSLRTLANEKLNATIVIYLELQKTLKVEVQLKVVTNLPERL